MHPCQAATGAPSAAPARNPAKSVVALVAVLGSGNVEMKATQPLSIRGTKAGRLAKVSWRDNVGLAMCMVVDGMWW